MKVHPSTNYIGLTLFFLIYNLVLVPKRANPLHTIAMAANIGNIYINQQTLLKNIDQSISLKFKSRQGRKRIFKRSVIVSNPQLRSHAPITLPLSWWVEANQSVISFVLPTMEIFGL